MTITYSISSYGSEGDDTVHAVTGDGWIAYGLFYDLIDENPDRVYSIEAYTGFDGDEDSDCLIKETPEGVMELIAYIRGTKEEKELDIVTFNNKPEVLNEALEDLGLSVETA